MTRRVYKGQHISASGTEILRDGALAVDLATNTLYIHDGVTPGGIELLQPTAPLPEFIFRAQRIAGGNATDLNKWTFTTISGSSSASFSANFEGNTTILITLTGFTRMPSVGYQLDNIGQLSSAYVTSESMNLLSLGFSGSGFVSPGSPNIITTFTPATHKFAVQATYTAAKDFYFYFRQ